MGKQLYFECASGISGDMAVAALLDLGAPEAQLQETLATLPITEAYEIRISRVKKSGLDTCDFDVILPKNLDTHDHDMAYLYGHLQEKNTAHEHHTHRGPKEIAAIFDASAMTTGAKETAHRILDILTDAEAKAHGIARNQVHFHEVGAVDSIVDIVAAAVCLDSLQIEEVIVPMLSEGQGTVCCQHGILPIPVPAVTQIIRTYGIAIHRLQVQGELVTPTGAAIVAAIRTGEELPEAYRILQIGMGAGKREYETPGILRAMLIEGN